MKKLTFTLGILLLASFAYGGPFFKGGIILNSDVGGISQRWMVSAGSDYYIDIIGLGLEVQTAYHSSDVLTFVPINGFINLKVRPEFSGVKPVMGIGFGLVGDIHWGEDIDFGFDKHTGMHLIAGFELGPDHGPALAVEFQMIRALATGSEFTYVIFGGVRF